jgi:hypothetical protein
VVAPHAFSMACTHSITGAPLFIASIKASCSFLYVRSRLPAWKTAQRCGDVGMEHWGIR